MSKSIDLSIIVPVYNEAENLPTLFKRLTDTLDNAGKTYEIIFTNDGSKDKSLDLLKEFYQMRPDIIRIVDFQGNFGQHMAIMAAFDHARGAIIVTLDADLQNPPEEIPKLLSKMTEGFDYVGSYRAKRQDNFFRTYVSLFVNWFREITTDIIMRDQGCMLRAYSRQIVDQIIKSEERSTFIPALAYKFALNPTEIEVRHDARAAGTSKYNLYRLIRLNFDLITGFSLIPLQIFTLFGMIVSALSGLLVGYLILRRLILGPEAEGLFTLFGILFFLVSVVITGIGIIGEYLGRIFQTLSQRPRFVVRQVIEKK
ncbi:MAG: glycosyltransferase [Alphaproteobacteria bacterium]|nr:glycosyltransferase [Alphaproteobacteria bacterium]